LSSRKLIAYALIALIVVTLSTWTWLSARRKRMDLARRHGPRVD
jgi:hypothetical protein